MKTTKRFMMLCCLMVMAATSYAQQWEIDYGDPLSYTELYRGFINTDGDAIVMGDRGEDKYHYSPWTMKVDMEGNYVIYAFEDEQFNMLRPADILQLENGNYFMTGVKENTFVAAVFDSDFNAIHVKSYEKPENAITIQGGQMLLDDDGTIIFSGSYKYQDVYGQRTKPYFYRLDENADTLSCRFVVAQQPNPEATILEYDCCQLLKNPTDDGFVVLCKGLNNVGSLLLYDYDFNYVNGYILEAGYRLWFKNVSSDHWLTDNKLLVMGMMSLTDDYPELNIGMAEVNLDGTCGRFERIYCKQDTAIQAPRKCMAYVNDSTIYGIAHIYENITGPYFTGITLVDRDMEVLGRCELYDQRYENHIPYLIIPLPDGGCLLNAEVSTLFLGDYTYGKLIKMNREDFNPIPCSVEEVPQEAIKALAYPNPAKEKVTIEGIEVAEVQVYNVLGQLVKTVRNSNEISVSDLPEGIYLLRITDSKGVSQTERITVKR